MTKDWLKNYLTLLGIKGRAPTLETLTEVAKAHEQVAFSNHASLIRKAAMPEGPVPGMDTGEMLKAWHREGPGGVCYEVTAMASQLLDRLGFDSHVILGTIGEPRDHQANVVTIEGRRFMLDLGNGGPFFLPIPIDEGPYEIDFAGLGFRFDRNVEGQLVQYRR